MHIPHLPRRVITLHFPAISIKYSRWFRNREIIDAPEYNNQYSHRSSQEQTGSKSYGFSWSALQRDLLNDCPTYSYACVFSSISYD